MGNPYYVFGTTSHPRGSIVVLQKDQTTKCSYYLGDTVSHTFMRYKGRVFFDKKQNGRLDKGDKTYETKFECEKCPRGTKTIEGGEGAKYCVRSVTARDIKRFRKLVNPKFKMARRLRRKLAPIVRRMHRKDWDDTEKSIKIKRRMYKLEVKRGTNWFASPDPGMPLEVFGLKNKKHRRYVDAQLILKYDTILNLIDIK